MPARAVISGHGWPSDAETSQLDDIFSALLRVATPKISRTSVIASLEKWHRELGK
jgi:hypothetical protein